MKNSWKGRKEGFQVALRIIPYLVTMLVAIGMFRGSGGIDLLTAALRPVLNLDRVSAELMPLALMRPLSGSGSNALFVDLIKTVRARSSPHLHGRDDHWQHGNDLLCRWRFTSGRSG